LRQVHVPLGERSYDITIGNGLLSHTGEIARATLGDHTHRVAVISNPLVHARFGRNLARSLREAGFAVDKYLIADGERAKSLRMAEGVWSFLIAKGFERRDAIIALGGGVVGDLAGFVAATYLRGIAYVHVPTTLLAQIDSSVGGKTAINHRLGKNLIGAFHQPRAVIIDPKALTTLPLRELRAGLYEMLKYGIIRDRDLFDRVIINDDPASLAPLIARCCEIKSEVVTADERESGLRKILNFGHTVGHALEAVTAYRRLKHGEAVGYGMKCAAMIAREMELLSNHDCELICERVDALGRLPRIDDLKSSEVIAAMARDKKVAHGRLTFILPTTIGAVVIRDDVPKEAIRKAIRSVLSKLEQ
jgi:3-dehydroquinate synthase